MFFECCKSGSGQRLKLEEVVDKAASREPQAYGPPADNTVEATYLVIWKSGLKVRAGLELSSDEVRTIPLGSIVDVFERKDNAQGVLRMRVEDGWVNETYAGSDDPLVERVDTDERCPRYKLVRVDDAGNGGTVWDGPCKEKFVGAIDVGQEVRFVETFQASVNSSPDEAEPDHPSKPPDLTMPSPGHVTLPGNEEGSVLDSNGDTFGRITSPVCGWVVSRPANLLDSAESGPLFEKVVEIAPEQTQEISPDGAEAEPEPDPSVPPARPPRTSGVGTWTEILCDGLFEARDWIDSLHDVDDPTTHFFMTMTKAQMTSRTTEEGRGLYEIALKLEGAPDTEYAGVAEYKADSTLEKGRLHHAHFEFTFEVPLRCPGKAPFTLWGCQRSTPGNEGQAQSFPMTPDKSVIMLCLRDSKGRNRRFQQKGGARPSPSVFASADPRHGETLATYRVICEAGLVIRKCIELDSEQVKTLPVGELLEVLEFAENEDGWLGQCRTVDGWASEFHSETNEPLIARAAADEEDVKKMRNGASCPLVPDAATGNRRKSRNGVELQFETQAGSGHLKTVIFQRRPLGVDFDPKPPHRVLSVTDHAQDLGVQQGWLLLRVGDMELRESFRLCAVEDIMSKFNEVVGVLPDAEVAKKKKKGCSIS